MSHWLGEPRPATAFAFPPAEPGVIYAAVGFGLLVSEDDGETWHAADDGLPQATVSALAVGADLPRCTPRRRGASTSWSRTP